MKTKGLWAIFGMVLTVPLWGVQGTLQTLKGSVSVQTSEGGQWVFVKHSMAIEEGTRIQTGPLSTAFLITPDDHRVMIGPDSYMTLQRLANGETKLYLKSGSVRSKVRKLETELGHYYKLQTPTAVVAVRGTDFSVVQRETARVNVFEGVVDLSGLRADVAKETKQLRAGDMAVMDSQGRVEEKPVPQDGKAAPQGDQPEKKGPKDSTEKDPRHDGQGPPPPGQPPAGGTPGVAPNWWDRPQNSNPPPNFFGDTRPLNAPPPPTTMGSMPPPPIQQPPPLGTPPIPPGGNTGTTYPGSGPEAGMNALVDTLRSKSLHAQADAILVADLYQRHAVAIDPLTGQLRQYADAILSAGPDGIRFVNATMIAGVPDSLNYTNTLTRFNAALPTNYWDATKTAFAAGPTPPAWYAVGYNSDISNTVDHLVIDASGGTLIMNGPRYVTDFANMSARINTTPLWTKSGASYTFWGGAAPTRLVLGSGRADYEVKDVYSNGTFVSVRTVFADDSGHIVSAADIPSATSPAAFLESLNSRTLIRSNLLTRGSLDIFGSTKGRILSGMMTNSDPEAMSILNGIKPAEGASFGLVPS